MAKVIYSEKATKFCEISTLLLNVCTAVKSKVEISKNFVAFSEYMNFTAVHRRVHGTQRTKIAGRFTNLPLGLLQMPG